MVNCYDVLDWAGKSHRISLTYHLDTDLINEGVCEILYDFGA